MVKETAQTNTHRSRTQRTRSLYKQIRKPEKQNGTDTEWQLLITNDILVRMESNKHIYDIRGEYNNKAKSEMITHKNEVRIKLPMQAEFVMIEEKNNENKKEERERESEKREN